jgi:hypothetical protein
MFFSISRYVLTPGHATPARPPKVPFLGWKGMFLYFYVQKVVPVDTALESLCWSDLQVLIGSLQGHTLDVHKRSLNQPDQKK